jgi:ribosomal protein S18 acetylase RimI-like enzyme
MVLALYAGDAYGRSMTAGHVRRTADELTRHPHRGRIEIIEAAGAVVGYAIVVRYWSNEHGGTISILDELLVKPAWRGRGYGSAFLAHLAATAEPDVKGVLLEVAPANEGAQALYLRHGFRPAANRHLFKALP